MMDAPVMSIPPEWLHVRLDPRMPPNWRTLAELLASAVPSALGDPPPARAVLRVRKAGSEMRIRFFSVPTLSHLSALALRELGARTQALATALVDSEPAILEFDPEDSAHLPGEIKGDAPADKPSDPAHQQILEGASQVQVFRWDGAVPSGGGAERGRHSEGAVRIGKAVRRLRETGPNRPLCLPKASWAQQCDELARDFPNFGDVISSAIRPHVALSVRGIRHRLSPILLVGAPGIGKTLFANRLASLLNVPDVIVPMAAQNNGSTLSGSSTFWSNSSPGTLFEALAWGHRGQPAVANALLVLDELDKCQGSEYDPLGALYTLLEADTARQFVDESLPDILVDASHLRVCGTANDLTAIPAPLLNRMLVFEIRAPSPEQTRRIVVRLFRSVIDRLAITFDPQLPEGLLEEASALEPRRARLLLEAAVAAALSNEHARVEESDWRAVRLTSRPAGRQSMGFLATAC